MIIRTRPEKNTTNPPGQIVNPIPDAITEHNIREWKKWEESRKKVLDKPSNKCYNNIIERKKDD